MAGLVPGVNRLDTKTAEAKKGGHQCQKYEKNRIETVNQTQKPCIK